MTSTDMGPVNGAYSLPWNRGVMSCRLVDM